jgi:hypothetical protein
LFVLIATGIVAEAFCDRAIVQVVDVLALIAEGLHHSAETSTATWKLTVRVAPYPFAVRVTLRVLVVIVPEVTVKVAEVAPAGTLTEAGTVSADALLVSV